MLILFKWVYVDFELFLDFCHFHRNGILNSVQLILQEDDDDLDLFAEETEEEKAASEKREAEKKASGKPKVGEYV